MRKTALVIAITFATTTVMAADTWFAPIPGYPQICNEAIGHPIVDLELNSKNAVLWNGSPVSSMELARYLKESAVEKGVYAVWFVLARDKDADRKVLDEIRTQILSMGLRVFFREDLKDCVLAIP